MPTIDRLSSTAAVSWLRRGAGRLRRMIMAQRPAVRLALVLAPVLFLAAACYWAAGTLASPGPRFLEQGREFSSEDLITICRNLDSKGIWFRSEDRKIQVAADQYDQAVALLAKLDIGPHPINELRETRHSFTTMFDTPDEKEQQGRLRQEKIIERFIDGLDGVVWSVVSIQRPRAGFMRNTRAKPSAFVYLECKADRTLPLRTVQAITMLLTSNEPDLSAEAITVMDRKGHAYLDRRNPAVGKQTRVRAREEELRDQIVDILSWIDGVRVWVDLNDRRDGAASAVSPSQPDAADHRAGDRTEAAPSIAVNQPADIGDPTPLSPTNQAAVEKAERGWVRIYVPWSFYFSGMLPKPDHREPTVEELHAMAARTKEQVEKMVKPIIPESWTLDVGTLPDKVPITRPSALPAGSEHRRMLTDWGLVGAIAAASFAVVMAMGSWIHASRRPVRAIASSPGGRRYREDSADEPEPSERVRELVRRDPEAAASVLQRWATQGGGVT